MPAPIISRMPLSEMNFIRGRRIGINCDVPIVEAITCSTAKRCLGRDRSEESASQRQIQLTAEQKRIRPDDLLLQPLSSCWRLPDRTLPSPLTISPNRSVRLKTREVLTSYDALENAKVRQESKTKTIGVQIRPPTYRTASDLSEFTGSSIQLLQRRLQQGSRCSSRAVASIQRSSSMSVAASVDHRAVSPANSGCRITGTDLTNEYCR
jgi:hypothetical protein